MLLCRGILPKSPVLFIYKFMEKRQKSKNLFFNTASRTVRCFNIRKKVISGRAGGPKGLDFIFDLLYLFFVA